MNLIELHIIQSFPVSCLNRDDLGTPKSAMFGGCKRARISSQCLKRAQRLLFREFSPEYAQGERTRLIAHAFATRLQQETDLPPQAADLPDMLAEAWGKLDAKRQDADGHAKSTTLTYLSPGEMDAMLSAALGVLRANPSAKPKDYEKSIKDAMKGSLRKDAADIALFGRMVANDRSLNVEGAAMFSHALSCHKAEPEMDYYTAVDDLQPDDESGAGRVDIQEFNSACYYRYIGINLDVLAQNLPGTSEDERKAILRSFIRAALLAVPSARKNSMNASTVPAYVLGLRRSCGHPMQLANAFEEPVRSANGYIKGAISALENELQRMTDTWGMQVDARVTIPQLPIAGFISQLIG